MNERALIENWAEQKLSHNYYRLAEPFEVEYEFVRHAGHPSSYAFVKFAAVPAEELSLQFSVAWPQEFDDEYSLRIQHTIGEAIADALFGVAGPCPYRGCALALTEFGWDVVGGSGVAVHRATSKAMEALCSRARWEVATGRYRSYA